MKVRFLHSEEWIEAPANLNEEEAARWALRLHNSCITHVRLLGAGTYEGTNRRRGPRFRGAIVCVRESDAKSF